MNIVTYSLDQIACSHNQHVFPLFEFVELGQKSVDHLRFRFSREVGKHHDGRQTLKPSDGSVPAIAPALAAVRDSTSSIAYI